MEIKNVDHIGVAVKSIDEALKFWEDTLGVKCHGIEAVSYTHLRRARRRRTGLDPLSRPLLRRRRRGRDLLQQAAQGTRLRKVPLLQPYRNEPVHSDALYIQRSRARGRRIDLGPAVHTRAAGRRHRLCDVYDRRLRRPLQRADVRDDAAVSYTHLDVYKRQGRRRRGETGAGGCSPRSFVRSCPAAMISLKGSES